MTDNRERHVVVGDGVQESSRGGRISLPPSTLDLALTAQIVVAWAGERGEEPRLGWWRTDLASEFGGEDLFKRLLPSTWRWATLQAVREAARRRDAELRAEFHDPDRLISLFHLGFAVDEAIDERLQELKRTSNSPSEALPGLAPLITSPWDAAEFETWVEGHGRVETVEAPTGRRLVGQPSDSVDRTLRSLVAGLLPLGGSYPLPHYQRN